MTRISTTGQNQFLLDDVFNLQKRIFDTTKQISSESKSDTYQGIGVQGVKALSASKAVLARAEQYLDINSDLKRTTEVQALALKNLAEVSSRLKTELITASQPGGGVGLRDTIDALYLEAVEMLNIAQDGKFIFGGTRTDQLPVTTSTPAALEALGAGNHAQAFQNNSVKPQALVSDELTITYGSLADEVATNLFDLFQDLMIAATASAGKFRSPLTDAERTFVIGLLDEAETAFDTINLVHAQHGVVQNLLEDSATRHADEIMLARQFIGDIENIDVAEAISNLNQDQVALEASFRVFSQLNSLSLINFI